MTPKQLFRDRVCLWLNTTSLEQAIAIARDMRSCTRTALISPNFFLAHGPNGIRCFYELGIHDVILDLRVLGSPQEIWQCVMEAAKHGVKAVSVHAMSGKSGLQVALMAAEASKKQTLKENRPRVLIAALPASVGDAEMIDDLGMRLRRNAHVALAAKQATELGLDGIIAEYEDVPHIRKVSKQLPMLVYAQKKARNYMETEHEDDKAKAGITEILSKRASHVVFDSTLVRNSDVEWSADLISKELAPFQPVGK